MVALLLLSYRCIVTINVLWLFLTVPWDSLQCVVVVFPDNTHLLIGLGSLIGAFPGYNHLIGLCLKCYIWRYCGQLYNVMPQ